jgi:hypothetical protein
MTSNKKSASSSFTSIAKLSAETVADKAAARIYRPPRLSVVGKAVDLVQGPATGKYSDGPGHGFIER